ncbi:hypothetical protein [Sphingomonas endolithica]|uniref:hypothetical protein n=1 Tax=Sphingomonas endolithica TaxID=2972485 RepID=UPI0021AE7965|nr:hypothetical protein [Sphingomonas sp. ZFBP2030]
MIKAFVQADEDGKPLIADHYEFEVFPRVGDEIVVDNDDGEQVMLKVTAVLHFSQPKAGQNVLPTPSILNCDVIGSYA